MHKYFHPCIADVEDATVAKHGQSIIVSQLEESLFRSQYLRNTLLCARKYQMKCLSIFLTSRCHLSDTLPSRKKRVSAVDTA